MIYFNKIKKRLNQQYNLYADIRIKRISCFGVPIFIFIFLLIFQPFNINMTQDEVKKITAISSMSFSSSVLWIIHLYGIFYKKKNFSVGFTALLVIWVLLLIGVSNFVISELFSTHVPFYLPNLPVLIFWTFITGLIPMVFLIIIYDVYYVKSKVKYINQVNKIIVEQKPAENSEIITINSNIGQDYFIIPLSHLLFLQAAGNYVDVHYFDNGYILKHDLIRNTLSGVILQLNKQCDAFIRCHHSYVVNLTKVERVIGNSSSYKAVLKNSKTEIPISKKYKDQFLSLADLA